MAELLPPASACPLWDGGGQRLQGQARSRRDRQKGGHEANAPELAARARRVEEAAAVEAELSQQSAQRAEARATQGRRSGLCSTTKGMSVRLLLVPLSLVVSGKSFFLSNITISIS